MTTLYYVVKPSRFCQRQNCSWILKSQRHRIFSTANRDTNPSRKFSLLVTYFITVDLRPSYYFHFWCYRIYSNYLSGQLNIFSMYWKPIQSNRLIVYFRDKRIIKQLTSLNVISELEVSMNKITHSHMNAATNASSLSILLSIVAQNILKRVFSSSLHLS